MDEIKETKREEGQDNEGMILVKRSVISDMIKRSVRLSKMVILLSYVADVKKIQMTLTADEVCEILEIDRETLERCKHKNWIKSVSAEGVYVFKAYDIALLAERIDRRKILYILSKIPSIP